MKSKTIILSSQEKYQTNSPRAILTFIQENQNIDGKLRLYNMNNLKSTIQLGINYEEKVILANLIQSNGYYQFKLKENLDLNKNICCALVDTLSKDIILSGGNLNGFIFEDVDDNSLFKYNDENTYNSEYINFKNDDNPEKENDLIGKKKTTISTNNSSNVINNDNTICKNQEEDKSQSCCKCDDCIYKQYFYTHNPSKENKQLITNENDITTKSINNQQSTYNENTISQKTLVREQNKNTDVMFEQQTSTEQNSIIQTNDQIRQYEQLSNNTPNSEVESFISAISEQLDEMFKAYPLDETIMGIIPNSKVVKVSDTTDGMPYVLGVIYENNEIKYLLYGVPSQYNEPAPKELGNDYQWLPLNPNDQLSDGYYLVYQDATDGKIVPIRVE